MKYKLCFLAQSKQHYTKLLTIAKILESEYDIIFLIDEHHFTLDNALQHPAYEHKLLGYPPQLVQKPLSRPNRIKVLLAKFRNQMSFSSAKPNLKPPSNLSHTLAHIFIAISYLKKAVINALSLNAFAKGPVFKWLNTNCKLPVACLRFIMNLAQIQLYGTTIDRINQFLSNNKFDCLILAEANVEYLTEAFIKRARRHNIPSIITPYTFCLPIEPARHYYNDIFRMYRWYHKFFIPSKWVYKYNDRKLIRLYIHNIISMEKLRISPPLPWVQESSTAEALVVESEKMREHYLACKLKQKQLYVIGDEVHDRLFTALNNRRVLKSEILNEVKFKNATNKIITFAIFPDFMLQYAKHTGFKKYTELLKFICDQLSKLSGYNLILCLHPSLKKEEFKFLETKSIQISTRKTIELIAISDLYVASISATIRWAITAGTPVINYDCYQMRYGDYENVGGVLNIETQDDLIKTVNKIKKDSSYLKRLSSKQKSDAQEYGIIDGKFHERLKDLINRLIKEYKHK